MCAASQSSASALMLSVSAKYFSDSRRCNCCIRPTRAVHARAAFKPLTIVFSSKIAPYVSRAIFKINTWRIINSKELGEQMLMLLSNHQSILHFLESEGGECAHLHMHTKFLWLNGKRTFQYILHTWSTKIIASLTNRIFLQ